ncbi:MAG TPA: hypothetical protein VKX45_10970 [Bryobacteraceae bacterium]|nr:hypothetical protein [Bryobacteraceae bacterium]
MQRLHASTIWLLGALLWASLLTAAPQQGSPKEQRVKETAMSGCIDEQDGRYVLIDGRTREPIANLEAQGFPTEGFAKHLGHKVTVRGSATPGQPRPLVKVRSIEMLSESCEPEQPRRLQ